MALLMRRRPAMMVRVPSSCFGEERRLNESDRIAVGFEGCVGQAIGGDLPRVSLVGVNQGLGIDDAQFDCLFHGLLLVFLVRHLSPETANPGSAGAGPGQRRRNAPGLVRTSEAAGRTHPLRRARGRARWPFSFMISDFGSAQPSGFAAAEGISRTGPGSQRVAGAAAGRLVAGLELRKKRELPSPALDRDLRAEDRDDLALAQTRADGALDVRIGVGRIAVAGPCHALLEEVELVLGGQEKASVKPGRIVISNMPERVREPTIEALVKLRPRKVLGYERQERVREFRLLFGACPIGSERNRRRRRQAWSRRA